MKTIITSLLLLIAFALSAEPLTSTKQVIKSNTVYTIPDGTTLTGILNIANVENVTIKADNQAYLIGGINCTGSVSGLIIENLDISGYNLAIQIRSYGENNTVEGCTLHDCTYGIWLRSMNTTYTFNTNFTVERCRIFNTQNDGYYGYMMHSPKLISTVIYNNNLLWKAPETDQKIASGDGVQWALVDNPLIQFCTIDRSATGNKFCFIVAGTNDVQPNVWQISNNTFVLPLKTNEGGAGLYFGDLKANTIVEFDFNTVTGIMAGIKYTCLGTFKSTGNEFNGCIIAIEVQRKEAKGTSDQDSFTGCTHKVTSNVKLTN